MGAERHHFKKVTRSNPCPICGKPDWCGWMQIDEGELLVCQRDTEWTDQIGMDGEFYIFVSRPEGKSSSIYEEAHQRARRMNVKASDPTVAAKAKKATRREYTVINPVEIRDNKYLDMIYRYMLSLLYLDDDHQEYLAGEKWSHELMVKHMIRSFPEADFIRFKYKNNPSKNPYRKRLASQIIEKFSPQYGEDCLKGVPGAFKKNGEWTFAGPKGILFPQYDVDGNIYRLRVRKDYRDVSAKIITNGNVSYCELNGKKVYVTLSGLYELVDGTKKSVDIGGKGKYRNFSSYHINDEEYEKGFIVNDFDSGCGGENNLGFYMDPQRDNMYCCWITEGEKKGIFANDKLRAPFVSVPGVNSFSLLTKGRPGERPIDKLWAKGVRLFIIAFDADKESNEAVMKAEKAAIEMIRAEGYYVGSAEWHTEHGAYKGLDDLLAMGFKPSYSV